MRKRIQFKVPPEFKGERLDTYLAKALPNELQQELSKSKVRKLIMAGAVYLNQKRVRIASKELIVGAKVEVILDVERLFNDKASTQAPFEVSDQDVLFEDDWLIAVQKPSGIPTQPTLDQARDHLYAGVQRYLARREGKPEVYVGLHHRLDFDTSGVVLFTKKREANKGVAALFSERRARKTYRALGWNLEKKDFPDQWNEKNHLARAGVSGKDRMRFKSVRSGGDQAETQFRILARGPRVFDLEASPKTGRTHQIRVHMSEAGLPILGDRIYGLKDREPFRIGRLMLHAYRLEFEHPMTGQKVLIESAVPAEFSAYMLQDSKDY